MKHTIAIGCRATRGSSIRRIICEDSQTQSCRSTFNGFCKGSSRTIFHRFGDGSGSKSASLLSVSLPEDSDDLSKQKSIFLLWYSVLPGEIYFSASWWSYDVTSVVHCAGSEKSIRDPVPRPLASAPFFPLSWYNFFFWLRKFLLFILRRHCKQRRLTIRSIMYGVHLRIKIIENKIQFEFQKLDYPCRNLVIWIWNRNERSRNGIIWTWSYFEQVETFQGKWTSRMLKFKSPFRLKCKLHDLNFNSPSPLQ